MTPSFASVNPLLITIVLATLAIGLPIVMVMSIRFLADRRVNLGRSKEVEKLIWQLHRIASALEHQLNLSFPAVQPGTEEAQDLMYLHQMSARPNAATGAGATTIAAAAVSQPETQQAVASAINSSPATLPPLQTSSPDAPRRGVNSMFDL